MSLGTYSQRYSSVDTSTAGAFAFDTIGGTDYAISKLAFGALGSVTYVSAVDPLPVTVSGTLTVAAHHVTNAGVFAVQVDGTALTRLTDIETNTDSGAVVGNGAAATAQRVTLANDSTGIMALTTSTASIGKLAANSGVDIGDVDVTSIAAGDNNIGNVDIVTVPTDPFGANADAASATGSISAKLRFIASTGIPITGTVTVGSHAVTNAGTFPVQIDGSALTALQLIDDPVQVLGTDTYTEAASKGMTIGAVRRDADTTLVNTTNEFGPLQMDANGRLKVEAFSGETLPVSLTSTTITGTVAVTQSGTWDEVGINDSGNSITVDNGGTFAVQAACTNAGTFAVQVDGSALTALQLIDDPVATLGTTTYTETSTKGMIIGALRRDADTTAVGTDNEIAPLIVNATGYLKVEAFSGETLPVSLASVPSHAVTNAGTFAVQVDGAALTALQLIDDAVHVDDAAFTLGTHSGVMIMGFAGTQSVNANDACALACSTTGQLHITAASGAIASGAIASGAVASGAIASGAVASGAFASGSIASGAIAAGAIADMIVDDAAFTPATSRVLMAGFQADETAADSVDEGDAGAARMTLDRKVIVTARPHTSGGWDVFNATSSDGATALTNSAQAVKASAGQVGGWFIYNPNASAQFVQFYNTASGSVTVGTTNPLFMLTIPATAAANIEFVNGIPFSTAISIAATSTAGGNGAPASAMDVVVFYK